MWVSSGLAENALVSRHQVASDDGILFVAGGRDRAFVLLLIYFAMVPF